MHRMPDDIGDFVESAIILLIQGMQDPALDRLQSIFELRNRSLPDDIRGVLEEIVIHEILERIFGKVQQCGIRRHGKLSVVHHQVSHDIFAALRRVLAHIELEKRLNGMSVIDADLREFHVGPDKGLEFGG